MLTAKVALPQPPAGLVQRQRLFERLASGASKKLTVVSAPAGSGKTTLLSAWVRQASLHSAWLSLDEHDNDPQQFGLNWITSLQSLKPETGLALLPLLQAQPSPNLETIFSLVLDELGQMSEPGLMILDDYHTITSQAVHSAVIFLIEHLPPNIHLVVAARADPPFALARYRVRGELEEIRQADLSFNAAETADYFERSAGVRLTGAQLELLETRTEGWAAGIYLAALSLRGREDVERFLQDFAGTHRYVLDYLLEEVLARQRPEVQGFLLRAAAALSSLQRALQLAQADGFTRTFIDFGQPMRELVQQAMARGIMSEAAGRLAAIFNQEQGRPAGVGKVQAAGLAEPLSQCELEVLRLVASGLSNQAIAGVLLVSSGTVKKHLNNLFGKLEVQSRTQAVARAREFKLL